MVLLVDRSGRQTQRSTPCGQRQRGSVLKTSLLAAVGVLAVAAPVNFIANAWGGAKLRAAPRPQRTARAAKDLMKVDGDVEPLGSYVLVKVDEAEEMTKGGLLLPKQDKPKSGEVVKSGPGDTDSRTGTAVPVLVQPGAKVLYGRYSGAEALDLGGAEHTLVREDEILLTYTGAEPTVAGLTMPRGRFLVKLVEKEEQTETGLFLSKDAVKQSTTVGEVISVGPGEINMANGEEIPPQVAVGDMVRFQYGDEIDLDLGDEGRFSSVRAASCLAKWKPTK
eukprot:TRINITY_DN111799_c0_g1_i1.p1 TRINITY_DN111799_c0_g1~~TRINITY_DN111799_c0_g1_i1.p1  ORF type:complete len:279 (-),score=78.55 TRINITY_DN111799_c0_g1_i1:87-923(-)